MNKIICKKKIRYIVNFGFIILLSILFLNLCLWDVSNKKSSIFNSIGVAVVVSDSMEPVLSINDVVVTKKEENYDIGDIVIYKTNNEFIIHRIVDVDQNDIITKGDSNEYEDIPINIENIYGKLIFSVPFIGGIVKLLKTNSCLFLIIIMLLCLFIYSCRVELKNIVKE